LRILLVSFLMWIASSSAFASQSIPMDTGKVTAQLVTSHDEIAPGQTFQVALKTVLDDKWHTYWRNPGDSGEPVQISWEVSESLTYKDIVWPLPSPIATGPIINYGFEGTPFFPVEFTLSERAQPGSVVTISADVYYLVCYDVCIPESAKLSLPLLVGEAIADTRWIGEISNAIARSPVEGSGKGSVEKRGDTALFTFSNLPQGVDLSGAYFFPFDLGLIDHSAPQTVAVGSKGLSIITQTGYAWDEGVPSAFDGVLKFKRGGEDFGTQVTVTPGAALDIGRVSQGAKASATGGLTLWGAIIGALLGGLVLNLMPCVFPVISIKALSIAKTAHGDKSAVRREGWLYTAGVIVTFMLLTAVLLAFKAGGAELGWGFQLQSPKLVAALSILLFIIGLNLLGVFEFGTSLQNTGSDLTHKEGWAGSFFTGALAVVVATPCTAPFMAGAVGYALSAPAITTIVVFLALAIGFALPFLLISYAPGLLTKLPKPGPWMIRFREFLAFPMFAASIWLVWVLGKQAGADGMLAGLLAMLAFGFGIWFFKRSSLIAKVFGVIAMLVMVALPFTITGSATSEATSLKTEKWSPEKVRALRAEGRPVFVDFTADWCVTCKVNERLVLKKKAAQELFEDTNTAFLVADWTNKNDEIARELASHGRSGVPLYLVYAPIKPGEGNNDVSPAILPQILTQDVLRNAIEGAQNP